MDLDPISPISDRQKKEISIEIDFENDLDSIQPDSNLIVMLTINSVVVATLEVRNGGLGQSEAHSHHYVIRPMGCSKNALLLGKDVFHHQGVTLLVPDPDHTIGGYFNSGTTVIIQDRSLVLPSTLVEEPTLEYVESPVTEGARLSSQLLCESQIHPGSEESTEFYYTHNLGAIVGVSRIGMREKNQDLLAVLCSPELNKPSKIELLVLDGNYDEGAQAALSLAERRKTDFAQGVPPQSSFRDFSSEFQNQHSHRKSQGGTTVCSASITEMIDNQARVEFSNLGDSRFFILRLNQQGEFKVAERTRPRNLYYELLERGIDRTELIELASIMLDSKFETPIREGRRYLEQKNKGALLDLTQISTDIHSYASRHRNSIAPSQIAVSYVENLKSCLTSGIFNHPLSATQCEPDTYQEINISSGDIVLGITDGVEIIENQMLEIINELKEPPRILEELGNLMGRTPLGDNASLIIFFKS